MPESTKSFHRHLRHDVTHRPPPSTPRGRVVFGNRGCAASGGRRGTAAPELHLCLGRKPASTQLRLMPPPASSQLAPGPASVGPPRRSTRFPSAQSACPTRQCLACL